MNAIRTQASASPGQSGLAGQVPPRAWRTRAFLVVFAVATAVIYVACEMRNWPLFTFHPATNRFELFWKPARSGEGPAMYWYGWTATALLCAAALGALASALPQRFATRIPPALAWIVPTLAIPVLFYSLMPFWTR